MTIDYPSYYDVFEKLQKGTKIQLGIPVSCHLALQSSLTSLYDYNKTATLMRKKGDFLSYKEYYHQCQCINSLLHYSFMESNEEIAKEYNTNYQQLVASTPQQTTKQWQQQGLFVEWKYDGFRIQIHKERDNYYVFGRNGNVWLVWQSDCVETERNRSLYKESHHRMRRTSKPELCHRWWVYLYQQKKRMRLFNDQLI